MFSRDKIGWDRVSEVLDSAVSVQRASPDDARIAKLAEQWCAVEPEPRQTADGLVRVCNPEPPVIADGTNFTLELGGDGVVGLVAADLTRADSEALAAQAQQMVAPLCTEPWTPATPNIDVADPRLRHLPRRGWTTAERWAIPPLTRGQALVRVTSGPHPGLRGFC